MVDLSPAEVFEILEAIRGEWQGCTRCELHRLRRSVVVYDMERYADGDIAPFRPLLVIGEAPGEMEDRDGRPFVGPSGTVLREHVLRPAGVRDVLISNVVACRPPRNRTPSQDEAATCQPRLADIVTLLPVQGVLFVGKTALEAALHMRHPILDRGLFDGLLQAHIVHPSFVLRNGWPSSKRSQELIGRCVGTVKRLLHKMEERRVEEAENADMATEPPTHEHVWQVVGQWARHDTDVRLPMHTCMQCKALEEPILKRSRKSAA